MRRPFVWFTYLLAGVLLIGGALIASSEAPTLTEQQRLLIQNRVLAVRLADAQLQLVLRPLEKDGYDIDLDRIEYVKKPETKGP